MKIIVCLKEVIDPALNLDFGLTNSVVFREGQPLRLNPNDTAALSLALGLKSVSKETQVDITLVSIGPERVESYLRNGLALGAEKAVRIWDECLEVPSPYQKAHLLTRAISLLGADLVLTGTQSLDTGHGQVGPFVAGWLGLPCVNDVIALELNKEQNTIYAIKDIGWGKREKLGCNLPAVVTVKGQVSLPYAPLNRLIESQYSEVILYSLDDLGVLPFELQNEPFRITSLVFPRPLPRKAPPLDSSLPAFERILQLLAGGIAGRKGSVLEGKGEELAERLFELLKEDGVIKPALNS